MSDRVRILALSDINWRPYHRNTNLPKLSTNLIKLSRLVEEVEPALVLLGGDLVDDFKREENAERIAYWQELSKFLDYLESKKVQCYFVKGNWDAIPEYDELATRQYKYVREISNKLAEANNLRVFGISHALTDKLSTMKELRRMVPQPVDVVLAHAEGRRRIWLFELPTKVIVTGHFDQKLCIIRNKLFISFSHFPGEYAVVEYLPTQISAAYFSLGGMYTEPQRYERYEAHLMDGIWTWETDQPNEWLQYGLQMEALLTLKEHEQSLSIDEKREAIDDLLQQGVYKAHILEYIPGARRILK